MERHGRRNPSQPTLIADALGEAFTGAKVIDNPPELCEYFTPDSMMRKAIDVLGQAAGIQLFDRRHDPSVERPPPVLENARIGDLVSEGVLERVFQLWDESRLVQELAAL